MAIDIYTDYLFLKQAQIDDRKKIIAKRFITTTTPKIKMNYDIIVSGEQTTDEFFEQLVGAVPTKD
jgi:hypothetical protein